MEARSIWVTALLTTMLSAGARGGRIAGVAAIHRHDFVVSDCLKGVQRRRRRARRSPPAAVATVDPLSANVTEPPGAGPPTAPISTAVTLTGVPKGGVVELDGAGVV